jgi:hypothetical protein
MRLLYRCHGRAIADPTEDARLLLRRQSARAISGLPGGQSDRPHAYRTWLIVNPATMALPLAANHPARQTSLQSLPVGAHGWNDWAAATAKGDWLRQAVRREKRPPVEG